MQGTPKRVTAVLLALSFLFNAAIVATRLPTMKFSDFIIFYSGAQIVRDGNAETLYDMETQSYYQRKLGIVSFFNPNGILPYNHPAFELLPFIPLTYLSFKSAYVLWVALCILLLVLTCMLLLPYFPREHRWTLAAVVFTFQPVWMAILRGQDSLISLLLLTTAFLCLKAGREAATGCVLGLGLYKPQLVLPIAILLLVKRRWCSVRAFVATGACLVALSSAMIGWRGVIAYVNLLSWMDQTHYTIYPRNMANVHGFVETLLGLSHPGIVSNLLIATISVALFIWCVGQWRGEWEPSDPLFDLRFSHLIVVTLLISYHAYAYDLILLTLPLVLSLRYVAMKASRSRLFVPPLLVISILFCFPLVIHVVDETHYLAWVSLWMFLLAVILSVEITGLCEKRGIARAVGDETRKEAMLL
jgi:hypothetical protein